MRPFLSDHELSKRILELDDELIENGCPPCQRRSVVELKLSEELRVSYIIGKDYSPPHVELIDKHFTTYYRKDDLIVPPMHVGAFLFRDIFFPIRIPVVYGKAPINPASFLCQATSSQLELIFGNEASCTTFYDQFIDLFDFSYGLDDLNCENQVKARALELWRLSKWQLEAAAAISLGSFAKEAITQNCCIAVELLLKGAIWQEGIVTDEKDLGNKKEYSHNLPSMARKVGCANNNINSEVLEHVAGEMPRYIKSRYYFEGKSRSELGRLLMLAQLLSGEVLRCYSERNLRLDLAIQDRTYPTTHSM